MNNDSISYAFRVAECLDNARWKSSIGGQSMVKYARDQDDIDEDKRAEYIILSHWITYICERQMPFEQIWNNGGFVFSDMVYAYQNTDSIDGEFIERFVKAYRDESDNKIKLRFVSEIDNSVDFASRYTSVDLISIIRTLYKLKEFDGLKRFLNANCSTMDDLLFSLYDLSYNGIGRVKTSDLVDDQLHLKTDNILDIIQNPRKPVSKKAFLLRVDSDKDLSKKTNKDIYHSKRTICALRDYFKSGYYVNQFKKIIVEANFNELSTQLNSLELPGDVWNNNLTFGGCMRDIEIRITDNDFLNKSLRYAYNKIIQSQCNCEFSPYPEQFDVTFDFVPRMCEKNKCGICLFNRQKGFNEKEFEKYCIGEINSKKICPIMLQYCGYDISCEEAVKNNACLNELLKRML